MRLVSMPCMDRFAEQDRSYRDRCCRRRARARGVEAASRSAGTAGSAPTARSSGWRPSAPGARRRILFKHFGFTPEHVAEPGPRGRWTKLKESDHERDAAGQRAAGRSHRGRAPRLAGPDRAPAHRERRARSRLVEEESLRGVTSNPTIFNQAILGAARLRRPSSGSSPREGKSTRGRSTRTLAIQDIQAGCDVLRPVYDETGGYDGYVSFEVDPDLAFDTEKTMEQAREYWQRVDRPNLMIKIPGTDEGTPDDGEEIYEGLNINVTLLFSVAAYERVAEAFIRGLERRLEEGKKRRHPLGRVVLRLARGHRGRQAPRGHGHGAQGQGRPRERPRRLQALQGDLLRRALRGAPRGGRAACSARCGRRPA